MRKRFIGIFPVPSPKISIFLDFSIFVTSHPANHLFLCMCIFSSIHDHMDSHCFMKILQGNLKETLFEWPGKKEVGEMVKKSERVLRENQCAYIAGKPFILVLGVCNKNSFWGDGYIGLKKYWYSLYFQIPDANMVFRFGPFFRFPHFPGPLFPIGSGWKCRF